MTSERRRALRIFLLLSAFGCQSKPEEPATSPQPSGAPSTPVAATTASEQPTSEEAPPSASASASASAAPAVTATSTAASTTSKTKQTAAPAAAYTGDDPCTHKTLRTARVRNACHTGGRPAAKTLMKNMVAKAKAAGENIKCTSCHVDLKKFDLKDNALDDLKKWL